MDRLSLAKIKSFATCGIALRAILLCLVFRALIPVGFMPSFGDSENGRQSLVKLCHGDAGSAQLISLLNDGSDLDDIHHIKDLSLDNPGASSHHQQCVFSAFSALGLVQSFSINVAFLVVPELTELNSTATLAIFYPSHYARAPPLFTDIFTGKLIPV